MWQITASKWAHVHGTEGQEKCTLLYCVPRSTVLTLDNAFWWLLWWQVWNLKKHLAPSLGTHTHTHTHAYMHTYTLHFFSHTLWSTRESEQQLLNIKLNYKKKKWRRGKESQRAWKQAEKVKSKRTILEQFRSVWNELIRPLNKSFNLKYLFHFWTL